MCKHTHAALKHMAGMLCSYSQPALPSLNDNTDNSMGKSTAATKQTITSTTMFTLAKASHKLHSLKRDKASLTHLFHILLKGKHVVPVLAEWPATIVGGVTEHPEGVGVTVCATFLGQNVFWC